MSQQYDYPPPPPTRSGVGAPVITSPHQHERLPPPVIATNLALGVPSHTPISATSLSPANAFSLTPNSPSVSNQRDSRALAPPSSARTPVMEPYDPRQWSTRRQVSGSQMVFQHRLSTASTSTRESTGMEASMPSPPPPYTSESNPTSATRRIRPVSMIESSAYVASPVQISSAATSSSQATMSPNFPPPPHQSRFRERSSSGQRAFFNLGGIRKPTLNTDLQSIQAGPASGGDAEVAPPAAKRASSTGHLYQLQTNEQTPSPLVGPARKSSPPSNSWNASAPLPGPPPGPPPPATRTQSLNRYPESSSRSNSIGSERSIDAPIHRRAAAAASTLGPVPPTPAGWVDPDAASQPFARPLRIDTGAGLDRTLARRPAKRDSSGHGIRERRSRSRAAKDGPDMLSPDAHQSRPEDLVFATSNGSISRRRDRTRVTPGEGDSAIASTPARDIEPGSGKAVNNVLTPPYTPAIGKSTDESSKKLSLRTSESTRGDRPTSQVLKQTPLDSTVLSAASPARPSSSTPAKASAGIDQFLSQAIERHRTFIEKEALAASDEERLELFASFMVHESRLRRDRYAGAYNAMAGEIVDLTRDMWRPYTQQGKRPDTPNASTFPIDRSAASSALDGRLGTSHGNIPSSASSFEGFTPATDSGSLLEGGESIERSESRQRLDTFKPSLSPIPSMNISSVADEEGSRGRAPSRWWENSNSGSNSIGNPDRMEKSHRETKYMGVNLAELQQTEHDSPRNSWYAGVAGSSSDGYGANEYPPEKVGWHEPADVETPMPTPGRVRKTSDPGATPMDVSRLLTLPPPYPRHYPAVKNKHPQLSDLRNEYRSLADRTKIDQIKEAYVIEDRVNQRQQDDARQERLKQLRGGIQARIANRSMSYAEAAQAEAEFEGEESRRSKAIARSIFDVFEATLAHPLNTLLTERLDKASECISQLQVELESQNEISDPNQAQEEGDEQPERLERLTLLKWLFEAREQLHKEMYDLHGDRSTKYSEVILTPFRIAKQQDKIDDATAFFIKDSRDRLAAFAEHSLQRFTELQRVMDSNVTLGVEDQLSAFWDIAPGLLEVIQQIPSDMAQLDIAIPDHEFIENPAFNDHPLQYLYSLLSHSEKSTYQFIESQTNLLCLRHEVQTATAESKLRVMQLNNNDEQKAEAQQERREQEDKLTNDLKEKVGEVERQWREALGENLEECKARVRSYLQETGGWEEGLEG